MGNLILDKNNNKRDLRKKNYELSDHLGNVTITLTDRKFLYSGYYSPDMQYVADYFPFGYPMPDRAKYLESYRFGFNGQESDNEVYGDKQSYTAEFWQYDTRLGRRWNIDPKGNPWESPYSTFAGNPILFSDPDGDFKTKFSAWIYKVFHGNRGEIFYDKDKSEWGINRNVNNPDLSRSKNTTLEGIDVFPRIYKWTGNRKSSRVLRGSTSNRGGLRLETNKPGSPQGSDIISTDPDVPSINVDNMPFVRGFPKKGNFLDWLDYSIQMFETGQVLTESVMGDPESVKSSNTPSETNRKGVVTHKAIIDGKPIEIQGWRKDSSSQAKSIQDYMEKQQNN
jgi:hypothetical protein